MHVLPVKHVVDIPPLLFVIFQVVVVQDLPRLPVSHDKVHEDHRLHVRDVNFPLSEPLCAVGSARDRRADFDIEVATLIDIH